MYDTHTRLVRFAARDYDPSVGRWTTKDPLLFAPSGLDLFAYAFSDSKNSLDPEGESVLSHFCKKWIERCWEKAERCKQQEDDKEKACEDEQFEICLGDRESGFFSGERFKKCFQRIPECQKAVKWCGLTASTGGWPSPRKYSPPETPPLPVPGPPKSKDKFPPWYPGKPGPPPYR
ncbi:MAG: RHS repeat domain-containing protein [Thermoanaerobaculum sp.]